MWKNIKSNFILKNIFSKINYESTLKILKYNKCLQKKLYIGISNYQKFSGKYIVYENKRDGKEYDVYHNKLLYEGEYLNGQRHGNGREYYYNIKYGHDGESLNEEINTNEEDIDGRIKFNGIYLKGKKWNGTGYDTKNNIIYNLNNGNGIICEYYDYNELKFQGKIINGQKNGEGREYYSHNRLKFEGEYCNGKKWNGKGYDTKTNLVLQQRRKRRWP